MGRMNLTYYKPTEQEVWINERYQEHGIYYPSDMDISVIANIFEVDLVWYAGKSCARWGDTSKFILMNEKDSEEKQREEFFHEIGHPIIHVGRQSDMSELFVELQEAQANAFQLYAAMPYYMFDEFKEIQYRDVYIKTIAERFILPIPLVRRRIEQMERRIMIEKYDQDYLRRSKPVNIEVEYMPETLQVLERLEELRRKRQHI